MNRACRTKTHLSALDILLDAFVVAGFAVIGLVIIALISTYR